MDKTTTQPHNNSRRRWLAAFIGIVIFTVLLGLDLRFRGLAWQFFWSQTGEESVVGQLRGMVELGGNLIRVQPVTEPLTPIQHNEVSMFGINTFLQNESERPKIEEQLRMLTEAGFTWIRQEFPWEDIEIDARGDFLDRRNDADNDGIFEEIDAWEKYDFIVDTAEAYGVQIQARISNPPSWTHADPNEGKLAPPDDLQDFVNFSVTLAERYQGRIHYYQIWNEPNIYPEWGENFADPVAYTEMLCATHDALKAVDPEIIIIAGAIAPTISLDGFIGYQDLVYLQNMYDAGAGDCFDIFSSQGYGLNSGPTDRRFRATTVNYQRHVFYRDIMVANGDAHKPIWLSEAAWSPVLDAMLPPDQIAQYGQFGQVTDEQNARYMPLAYQRAREEWPWIGQINYWFFTRHTIHENNQAAYYFRMAEADYGPDYPTFTPLPVYHTMKTYIEEANNTRVMYRGTHQAESWEVLAGDNVQLIEAEDAQFGEAFETTEATFSTDGTATQIRIKTDVPVRLLLHGTIELDTIAAADDWQVISIDSSFLPSEKLYVLSAEASFLLDSITVRNDLWRNVSLPAGVGFVVLLIVVGLIWRRVSDRTPSA